MYSIIRVSHVPAVTHFLLKLFQSCVLNWIYTMKRFLDILYLVCNGGLKFLLLELSDQRTRRKCMYFPCSCQEGVQG